MGRKIGFFSDLHGDKQNLELIVSTLKQLGIDSSVFLGDAIYKTMADYTMDKYLKTHALRDQLSQESPLRKDVLEGLFTKEQLQSFVDNYVTATKVGKKVARAEYRDIRKQLDELDCTFLGGNWDYSEEIADVFGDDFVNGDIREINGINFLGLSGGGTLVQAAAMSEIMADNQSEQGIQSENWKQKLLSKEPLNADYLVSHVPVTYGENVQKQGEPSSLYLKQFLQARKAQGLDVPKVNFHGHTHGQSVKFDEEMDMLMISVGSCSRDHNSGIPTFMVGEFDDEDNLIGLIKYGINSSLPGLAEVLEMGRYEIDFEAKEVNFIENNRTILKAENLSQFENNLSLDQNFALAQAGLNTNYDSFRDNPIELDMILRRNILVMQQELEEVSKLMQTAFTRVAKDYLVDGENQKLDLSDRAEAVSEVEKELAKIACERLGADASIIENSPYGKHIGRSLMQVVLGVDGGTLRKDLTDEKMESLEDIFTWGSSVVQKANNQASRNYQNHIFAELQPEDYQAMAEIYMPAAFERTKDLDEGATWNLWLKTYKEGLLTSKDIEATDAYQRREDFQAEEMTKAEMMDLFGMKQSVDDLAASGEDIYVNNLPEDMQGKLRDAISSGELPVLKDDNGEYLPLDKKVYLTDEFSEGLEYEARTMEEQLGDGIKNGDVPVIEKDGQKYAVVDKNGGMIPLDEEKLGLEEGDYDVLSQPEFIQKMRDDLIRQKEQELDGLKNGRADPETFRREEVA